MSAIAVPEQGPATRVVLVEPRPMLRHALARVLVGANGPRISVVQSVASLADSGSASVAGNVDVVLMSTSRHLGGAVRAVEVAVGAGARVLLHGDGEDVPAIRRRLERGASGFVCYDQPPVRWVDAVTAVSAGETWISPCVGALDAMTDRPPLSLREEEVFTAYAGGSAMKQVARQLGVAEHTAKAYLDRARAKYESAGRPARTRVELYQRAVEDGYLPAPQHRRARGIHLV